MSEELSCLESKLKSKFKVSALLLSLVSFMSVLFVGVVDHDPPHILHACVSWQGTFTYVSQTEAVASGCAQVSWKKSSFPLKVFLQPLKTSPFYDPGTVTMEGVAQFNEEVGFEFYRITTQVEEADIFMLYGVPSSAQPAMNDLGERHILGTTRHFYNFAAQKQQVLINIYDVISHMNILRKVIVHELGHAAGLAHNEGEEDELMYPTVGKLGFRDEPFHMHKADKAWLYSRYSRKAGVVQLVEM